MAAAVAQFYFRIGLGDVTFFRRSMSVSILNIVRITQSTAEISILQKRTSAILNFFRFRLWHITVIRMIFCIKLPSFIYIGPPNVEILRHIDFQDGGGGSILLPITYLLMPLYWEGQNLSVNQISSTYINSWLRYKYFRFWKITSAILEFYIRFRSRAFAVICMLFCIRLPNFVQIRAPTAEIWHHIHFSRWRPRPLNTTSGFVFVDVTAFRRSKPISKPNFVDILQLTAEI